MKRKKSADYDESVESLHCAVYEERMGHVEEFIAKGADVNALDGWGVGCLHYAVLKGRPDILRLLIQHGADLNIKDEMEEKTVLVWALELGQVECLKVLKESGVDLTTKIEGKAPIHLAVLMDLGDSVRFLLENGVCANDLCEDLMSPLQYAIQHYKFKVVGHLLDHGADVNYCAPQSEGITPLHVAVFVNNLPLTLQLLEKGADANAHCEAKRHTPTHCAAEMGYRSVLECLSHFGGDLAEKTKNVHEEQPLHLAARYGCLEAVEFLVDAGAPVTGRNSWGFTPLHVAALAGQHLVVDLLLQHTSVEIASVPKGTTPLHLAVQGPSLDVVKTLLARGANPFTPDIFGFTPVHAAASYNNVVFLEMVHNKVSLMRQFLGIDTEPLMTMAGKNNRLPVVLWLCSKGVPCDVTDRYGMTAMHHAASMGYSEMVQLLVNRGGKCNIVDRLGKTPLYYAMVHGWKGTVKLLVRAGATFKLPFAPPMKSDSDLEVIMYQMEVVMPYVDRRNGPNGSGYYPIHYATMGGLISRVKTLLDAGVDVNVLNDVGATPLMCAVTVGHLGLVELLLSRGADPNRGVVGLDNRTALHIASLTGKKAVAQMLLDHGADIEPITTPEGRTPLFWAVCAGYFQVVKLLVEKGANVLHRDAKGHLPGFVATLSGNTEISTYLMHSLSISPGA